jgi:dCMP deaminase
MSKRQGYISWDEYFMGVAKLSAQRSKDPNTQVGACIVDKRKRIVGVGYNGFPDGCKDEDFPWEREGDFLDVKYTYVAHAELNAILNSTTDLSGSTIYVGLFPCNECAKVIIQSGIKEVVYISDDYANKDIVTASQRMLLSAGVVFRKYEVM